MRSLRNTCLFTLLVLVLGTLMVQVPAQEKKEEAPSPAAAYKVDPVHSSILFRIKHLDVAYFYGRFNEVEGTVALDENQPEKSSLDIRVVAESVDTHNEKRNTHLKSPDFLNVVEFPSIAFESKSIRKKAGDTYVAEGDFTLHGITHPLSIEFEKTGEGKDPWGGFRVGGHTTFTIKRSDYGITFMPDGLSDEVEITISLEAVRK